MPAPVMQAAMLSDSPNTKSTTPLLGRKASQSKRPSFFLLCNQGIIYSNLTVSIYLFRRLVYPISCHIETAVACTTARRCILTSITFKPRLNEGI